MSDISYNNASSATINVATNQSAFPMSTVCSGCAYGDSVLPSLDATPDSVSLTSPSAQLYELGAGKLGGSSAESAKSAHSEATRATFHTTVPTNSASKTALGFVALGVIPAIVAAVNP